MEDIEGHMLYLQNLASSCDTITEFGVRDGSGSTFAFIKGVRKSLLSIDVIPGMTYPFIQVIADSRNVQFTYQCADSRTVEIEPCDFIFIDTDHTYTQLKAELEKQHSKALRYLGFHDTETFGYVGMDGKSPGLRQAIEEFLIEHPEWTVIYDAKHCNGLMTLERK